MSIIPQASSSELASSGRGLNVCKSMPEPTNLTDRISHLRDRKGGSLIAQAGEAPTPDPPKVPQKHRRRRLERKFAADYFMLFVYALLAIAFVVQLGLIVWLDVL